MKLGSQRSPAGCKDGLSSFPPALNSGMQCGLPKAVLLGPVAQAFNNAVKFNHRPLRPTRAKRLVDCFLGIPSGPEPVVDDVSVQSNLPAPLRHSGRHSVNNKDSVASPIVSLLNECGPPNISWAVVAIVVNPVQRVKAIGLVAKNGKDVSDKCGLVAPFRANRNPAPSIVAVGLASLHHGLPRVVKVKLIGGDILAETPVSFSHNHIGGNHPATSSQLVK